MRDIDLFKKVEGGDSDALAELFEAANAGDSDASVQLGMLFDPSIGTSLKTDSLIAFSYYEKAAILGNPKGQFFLGNMYHYGDGIEQNFELARHWYFAAASQGEKESQMHYARMLQTACGGEKNIEEAAEWYAKAVVQGHALAATNLAILHYEGALQDSKDGIAYNLFEVASEELDGLAHYFLGLMFANGRFVPRDPELSLYHFCIAVLLLPDGNNKDQTVNAKEQYLKVSPHLRDDFERAAFGFISERNGTLPM